MGKIRHEDVEIHGRRNSAPRGVDRALQTSKPAQTPASSPGTALGRTILKGAIDLKSVCKQVPHKREREMQCEMKKYNGSPQAGERCSLKWKLRSTDSGHS